MVRRKEEKEKPVFAEPVSPSPQGEKPIPPVPPAAKISGAAQEIFSVDIPKPRFQKPVSPKEESAEKSDSSKSAPQGEPEERVPVEEIIEPVIDEDKVSSWFFRKKSDAAKAAEDFYTSAGASDEKEGDKKKRRSLFWGILVGGGSLVVVLALLSTVFARATITIVPKVETVEIQNVAAAFDAAATEVVSKQKIIPAAKLEFSKSASQEFSATGKKNAEFKARGMVKIYNAFNSSPQSLVERTRFRTDKGILYRLSAAVTVPGAKNENGKIVPQFVEAELVADEAGEGGNLAGEAKLTVPGFEGTPKYSGFYALASAGFSGGARGERTVVTSEDRTRASEEITKKVYAELEKESSEKVPPDFTVVDALRQIEITKVDLPPVDSAVDRFTVSSDGVARLMVFRQGDVISFLRGFVAGKDQNREILQDSIALTYAVRAIDFVKGRADVTVRGSLKTRAIIPEQDIVGAASGRSADDVKKFLNTRSDISSAEVSFFPPWLLSAPSSAGRVKIRYK